MTRLLTTLLLSMLPVSPAFAGAFLDAQVAEKVSAGVWVIHGPLELPNEANEGFMNNPAFITTPRGVVVIDPGSSVHTGNMLLREILKVTDLPVIAVLDTHVHGDHWMGNDAIRRAYPDAEIYGHSKMIGMVRGGEGQNWLDIMHSMTGGATGGTNIVNAEKALNGGETLSLGGEEFAILHFGPAHTRTDIMIHYKKANVLFTGDNVAHGRILRLEQGSFAGNISTIENGIALKPAYVVPGHGRTGGVEIMQDYRDYLSTLLASVKEHFENDLGDFEMKPLVHEKLARYHDWPGYEEELGKQISNAYLEIEAAAF